MNPRQRFALEHPLERVRDPRALAVFRAERRHATGLLLRTILAVDR